jgi:hypothetical protein
MNNKFAYPNYFDAIVGSTMMVFGLTSFRGLLFFGNQLLKIFSLTE